MHNQIPYIYDDAIGMYELKLLKKYHEFRDLVLQA